MGAKHRVDTLKLSRKYFVLNRLINGLATGTGLEIFLLFKDHSFLYKGERFEGKALRNAIRTNLSSIENPLDLPHDQPYQKGVLPSGCYRPILIEGTPFAFLALTGDFKQAKQFIAPILSATSALLQNEHSHIGLNKEKHDSTKFVVPPLEKKHHDDVKYRYLLEATSDWTWETDKKLRFTHVGDAYFELTGLKKEDLIGKTRGEYLKNLEGNESSQAWNELDTMMLHHKNIERYEYEHKLSPETSVFIRISARPLYDDKGHFQGYVGCGNDISEMRQQQDRLKKDQIRRERILHNSPIGVGITSRKTRQLLFSNPKLAEFLGMDSKTIGSRRSRESWVDLDVRDYFEKTFIEKGFVPPKEVRVRKLNDGSIFWALVSWDSFIFENEEYILFWVVDIQAQKETELALQKSKLEADRANRAKSDFLSSISHELRTPMNGILGFSQLLEMDMANILNDTYKDHVQQIIKAGNHLLALIDDILDLAKIEAGKIVLCIEQVDCLKAIHESLELVRPMAERNAITLFPPSLDGPASDNYILADFTRLKQSLINLLSNAIKYNVKQGSVSVGLTATDKHLSIQIRDTGTGIPKDRMTELFDPFNRLDAENSGIQGTGVGLAITKNLVEMMGGTISVSSQPNQGSCFEINFHKSHLNHPPLPQAKEEGKQISFTPLEGKTYHCLYIEDNQVNFNVMKEAFSPYGYLVLEHAQNATSGEKKLMQKHYDLILLDLNLPDKHGFDLLSNIKTLPLNNDTPVIILSADAMELSILKARELGYDCYLTKPFELVKMYNAIHKKLANYDTQ